MSRKDRRGVGWRVGWLLVGGIAAAPWAATGTAETPPEPKPERVAVVVRVDFGPAGKPAREERLAVDEGSTAKDAVSLLFPIQSGAICCNTRELAAIDGIWADPAQNQWWTCRINGSTTISPFRTALHAGDRIEWAYLERPQ